MATLLSEIEIRTEERKEVVKLMLWRTERTDLMVSII